MSPRPRNWCSSSSGAIAPVSPVDQRHYQPDDSLNTPSTFPNYYYRYHPSGSVCNAATLACAAIRVDSTTSDLGFGLLPPSDASSSVDTQVTLRSTFDLPRVVPHAACSIINQVVLGCRLHHKRIHSEGRASKARTYCSGSLLHRCRSPQSFFGAGARTTPWRWQQSMDAAVCTPLW